MNLNLTKPLCIFDLETTGLNIGKDRIVEISIVKLLPDGDKIVKTELINPEIPISAESTSIHGIRDEDVKDKPTFKELGHALKKFFENGDLGGYNLLRFDVPLLMEEFIRSNIDFDIENRNIIDVQNIFHKMEQRTLKAAYKFYCSKSLVNAHSSEADALATYEILEAQIQKYKDIPFENKNQEISYPVKNDIHALHNFSKIHDFVDFAGHIVYNENSEACINFGKHKGKRASEVFSKEPAYYDWMMKADFPQYTKKVITKIKLGLL